MFIQQELIYRLDDTDTSYKVNKDYHLFAKNRRYDRS